MRKTFANRLVAQAAVFACTWACATASIAQTQAPLKVGFMLPATGTFAALGDMIEKGFKLYVDEQGGSSAVARCSTSKSMTRASRAKPPTTSTN